MFYICRLFRSGGYSVSPPIAALFPKPYARDHSSEQEVFPDSDVIDLEGVFQYPFKFPESKSGSVNVDSDGEGDENRYDDTEASSQQSVQSNPTKGSEIPATVPAKPGHNISHSASQTGITKSLSQPLGGSQGTVDTSSIREPSPPSNQTESGIELGGRALSEKAAPQSLVLPTHTHNQSSSDQIHKEPDVSMSSRMVTLSVPQGTASSCFIPNVNTELAPPKQPLVLSGMSHLSPAGMQQVSSSSPTDCPFIVQASLDGNPANPGQSTMCSQNTEDSNSDNHFVPCSFKGQLFLRDMITSSRWEKTRGLLLGCNPDVVDIVLLKEDIVIRAQKAINCIAITNGMRIVKRISVKPKAPPMSYDAYIEDLLLKYGLPPSPSILDLSEGPPSPIHPSFSTPKARICAGPTVNKISYLSNIHNLRIANEYPIFEQPSVTEGLPSPIRPSFFSTPKPRSYSSPTVDEISCPTGIHNLRISASEQASVSRSPLHTVPGASKSQQVKDPLCTAKPTTSLSSIQQPNPCLAEAPFGNDDNQLLAMPSLQSSDLPVADTSAHGQAHQPGNVSAPISLSVQVGASSKDVGGISIQPLSVQEDPSKQDVADDPGLATARSIVSFLIDARVRDPNAEPLETREDYSLLVIQGFAYPFAILPCEEDGNCGYHSIVRNYLPQWNCSMEEYSEQMLYLKQCTKFYNLHTFSPHFQLCLENDYPDLFQDKGPVKPLYDNHFGLLEITYPDWVVLSWILLKHFIIIRQPLNSKPSVLSICDSRLDPKSTEIIFILQTGADIHAATHGSHYSAIFPLFSIDGIDVTTMDLSNLKGPKLCRKALSRNLLFNRYGYKETQQCAAICAQSMPAPDFLLEAVQQHQPHGLPEDGTPPRQGISAGASPRDKANRSFGSPIIEDPSQTHVDRSNTCVSTAGKRIVPSVRLITKQVLSASTTNDSSEYQIEDPSQMEGGTNADPAVTPGKPVAPSPTSLHSSIELNTKNTSQKASKSQDPKATEADGFTPWSSEDERVLKLNAKPASQLASQLASQPAASFTSLFSEDERVLALHSLSARACLTGEQITTENADPSHLPHKVVPDPLDGKAVVRDPAHYDVLAAPLGTLVPPVICLDDAMESTGTDVDAVRPSNTDSDVSSAKEMQTGYDSNVSCIPETQDIPNSCNTSIDLIKSALRKTKETILELTQDNLDIHPSPDLPETPYKHRLRSTSTSQASTINNDSLDFGHSKEMQEIKESLPRILSKIKERKEIHSRLESKSPKRLQDQWALLSECQYAPFSLKISEVLPLDPNVLSVISNISYKSPLGCLVDFYFHLDEKRRVNADCMYTDPKKVSTSRTNNNIIQNTVGRFYTYVCRKTKLLLNDEASKAKVLQLIESPKHVQGFLMKLAESGRKSQSVFTSLSALHSYQRFDTLPVLGTS